MENESNPLLDLIQNLSNSLNETNQVVHNSSSENAALDHNSNNSNFNIMDILGSLSNVQKNSNSSNNQINNFDISNLIKMQNVITALSSEDKRKDLLITIKPFLRKSRQTKIDEYMAYLSVITALGALNGKKEEGNSNG